MQLSTRFPVAVQALIIIAWCPESVKVTSEWIALSVNTNPALIRRIMGYLKRSGLIAITPGTGGAKLLKPPEQITLLDIYRAVELTERDQLFGLHAQPNPYCLIGSRINDVLKPYLDEAREALEQSLSRITLAELVKQFPPFNEDILKSFIHKIKYTSR